MNDSTLLRQYLDRRNQSAFAELVDRHGAMVYATARRIAGEEAEDVAQAVFLLLAQRSATLVKHENLAGWLYRTARYCAANARRARQRRSAATLAAGQTIMPNLPPSLEHLALLEHLDRELSRLPSRYRHVLLLRYMESQSVEATASLMGLSSAAVMKRSVRGLARLRERFARRGIGATTDGVAGCMVGEAIRLSAAQRSTIASVAGGSASSVVAALASATGRALAIAHAKMIALVTACAIGGVLLVTQTIRIAIRHPGHPIAAIFTAQTASNPATPHNAATRPDDAVHDFLAALESQDTDDIASFLPPDSAPAMHASAEDFVRRYPAGIYARFPQQLTTVTNSGIGIRRHGGFFIGTFDIAPPIDAQLGHLTVEMRNDAGYWCVTSATFGFGDATFGRPFPDLSSLPASDRRIDWPRAAEEGRSVGEIYDPGFNVATASRPPTIAARFDRAVIGLHDLADTVRGSSVALSDADVQRYSDWLKRVAGIIRERGLAGFRDALDKRLDDSQLKRIGNAVFTASMRSEQNGNAQLESQHTEARPPLAAPVIHLTSRDGRTITVPGPMEVPPWLETNPAYRNWLSGSDVFVLITRDDAGNIYTLSGTIYQLSSDWHLWTKDKAIPRVTGQLRRYRPDKTLAATADWSASSEPTKWTTLDATGKQMTWQATITRDRKTGAQHERIIHFDADGNEHVYEVEPGNTIIRDYLADPIGQPREEPSPASDGGL